MMINKKIIFPLMVIIICIVGIVFTINYNKITFESFKLTSLISYFIISVFYLCISAIRTPIILDSKQYLKSFLIHRMSIILGSTAPIKLGLPIKIYLFKKYLGISTQKSTGAILYEIIISVFTIFILGAIFGSWVYIEKLDRNALFIGIPILLGLFFFLILIYSSNNIVNLLRNKILDIIKALRKVFNRFDIAVKIIIIQLIIQLIFILRIKLLLNGIGIDSLSIIAISRAIIISSFITTISVVPGGYGIKEVSIVFFLGLEGISTPDAIIVSLADRTFQVLISLIIGIFASLYFTNINRKEGLYIVNTSK